MEYSTLRIIWWVLLGVLLAGFAVMDGFDLGTAALLPFLGRKDLERRTVINTVGPVWEGNQVWIILGAGAIFAAWPIIYAVAFSSFYLAMLLLLLTFIIRPVAFKYRSKMNNPRWRSTWDWSLSLAAIVAALVFGVAIGNILQGIPFYLDPTLRAFYTGQFWQLFNPFALLCGLVSVSMIIMHGGVYSAMKTEGIIRSRAVKASRLFALLLLIVFSIAGYWVATHIKGYVLTQAININGPSNPLHKQVALQTGAWIANYFDHPWMILAPIMGFVGAIGVILFVNIRSSLFAFICSAVSTFGVVTTVGVSMFPFILPSSTNPSSSLLVWDASSSKMTLNIMLVAVVIFMPIILAYTSWAYWVMRGKVTTDYIEKNDATTY